MVFNTSEYLLSLEGNLQTEAPPCIEVSEMNVFAAVVNVGKNRPTLQNRDRLTQTL